MKQVLLFSAFIALAICGCDKQCQRPTTSTNFTRLNLEEVRKEIRFYFPSAPTAPPAPFISDASTIPTFQMRNAAPISVTFMFEGAGNRNQLGYYTFDLGANGAINNVKEFMLFPDIEADRNPPCVWTGMTVTGPVLPAGQRFGFYLVSDGYCGANQRFYTQSGLNNPGDANIRHVGLYVDYFRELMIIGFEDLLKSGWDNDFEDTMFIFDSAGIQVQFDGVPYACTNTPCLNGGVCNYITGQCDCSQTKYTGRSCEICSCSDGIDCSVDTCNGGQCVPQIYTSDISQCLRGQSCSNAKCVTTGIPTTGIPTTGVPTTGRGTTGILPSTAVTTQQGGQASSAVPTSASSSAPTSQPSSFSYNIPTTAKASSAALVTTGEILPSTRVRPNVTQTFQESGNVPTVSSDETESGAVVVVFSSICTLAVLLF